MPDVVLVTGRQMHVPDTESHLLVAAVRERGIGVEMRPWGDGSEHFDWASARLVVVRTPWDYFDHRDEFLAWAAATAQVTTLVNPFEVLEWNSHKEYLLDLQRRGVPTIATTVVPHGADDAAQLAALYRHDGEVVIKPAVSGGAIGAMRAAPDAAEARTHLSSLVASGDVLVQPLAESVLTEGETSLIYFGGVFSHAVRKIPAGGDYRVQTNHGGRVEAHTPTAAELEVADRALAATPKPTSYGRVDLVDVDGRPALMELEVIEPELFLGRHAQASRRFAGHLMTLLARQPAGAGS